jgi:hypothetical protein
MSLLYPATSALKIAVSLRLKSSVAIRSPPQTKKPPKGYRNPSKAFFTPPSGKFFHDFLQKVRVVLLVISVPVLFPVQRIADFGGNVHILYVLKMTRDSR